MSLDGFGRCAGMRDGNSRPQPFPERPIFVESGEPKLTGDPSEEEGRLTTSGRVSHASTRDISPHCSSATSRKSIPYSIPATFWKITKKSSSTI